MNSNLLSEEEISFVDGYVLYPDIYYRPSYRISPFVTADVALNFTYTEQSKFNQYMTNRYPEKNWQMTHTGKEAISLALENLNVKPNDCITIFTTTGNHYISGCVTREIEKKCNWSRKVESNTVAILLNHEFGFPHRDIKSIQNLGFPIIEDACHSFLADNLNNEVGKYSDFLVYSLPKVFPLQMGGILVSSKKYSVSPAVKDTQLQVYLNTVTSTYVDHLPAAIESRRNNYKYLVNAFGEIGCKARFDMQKNDVPGVFMFIPPQHINLNKLKEFGWRHGVECSVFYGEHAFFIPCHQKLTKKDLDYFVTIFRYFFERNKV